MTEENKKTKESTTESTQTTPGQQLKKGREAKGLSQQQVADRHRKKGMVEQELEHWWQEGTGAFYIEPVEVKASGAEPDEDGVYRRHFVQVADVRRELVHVMKIPPTIQRVSDGLKLIKFVAHPPPPGEGKAPTYQYRNDGVRQVAPRGFASPRLDCELESLSNAERGRRIVDEICRAY